MINTQTSYNQSMLKKILQVCEQFESGAASSVDLQRAIEDYGSLLEGVDKDIYKKLYAFTSDLESIIYFYSPEENEERNS